MTADRLAEHAFTDLIGMKVTMTAKRYGPPGLRLTPVVVVRVETPDGDYTEMAVPAISCAAFARVLDSATKARLVPVDGES